MKNSVHRISEEAGEKACCAHGSEAHAHTGHHRPSETPKVSAKYYCPMCPGVESDQPGDCPRCGIVLGIVKAVHLSRAVMRNIRQNLFFAFVYNALGVPVAAGLLYSFFGVLRSPIIVSAAMSLISVSVIGNALRLRAAALEVPAGRRLKS